MGTHSTSNVIAQTLETALGGIVPTGAAVSYSSAGGATIALTANVPNVGAKTFTFSTCADLSAEGDAFASCLGGLGHSAMLAVLDGLAAIPVEVHVDFDMGAACTPSIFTTDFECSGWSLSPPSFGTCGFTATPLQLCTPAMSLSANTTLNLDAETYTGHLAIEVEGNDYCAQPNSRTAAHLPLLSSHAVTMTRRPASRCHRRRVLLLHRLRR